MFTLQSSVPLLLIGMLVWMALMPAIEAAEQTVLQQVVPFEKQGRVFGFAQTIENAASPVTALMIGPFAQFVAMPFMTDGAGVELIGDWFGTGDERGHRADLHGGRPHRDPRHAGGACVGVVPPSVQAHRSAQGRGCGAHPQRAGHVRPLIRRAIQR